MRLRWFLVILSAAFPLLVGFISVQSAAAAPVVRTAAAAPAVHAAAASPAAVLNAPAGCPKGDVCFYYGGNGASLCGYTNADSYNLGSGPGGLAPFGNDCSNIGEQTGSGTIYNNGNPCSGCQDVKLYYDKGYTGASYCLPMGHYLLHTDTNFFPDGTADGEGSPLAYETDPAPAEGPGGVASAKWTSC